MKKITELTEKFLKLFEHYMQQIALNLSNLEKINLSLLDIKHEIRDLKDYLKNRQIPYKEL